MAITIQDLLASDTISQAVDKINFNFDQLLLNGGGPIGPAGPIGPPGPIGGRGERGTEWYEGTDNPNVTPPTVTPLAADYYLQSNGDVWVYTGLTWTNTGINLTGPQGATGSSGGWDFFGNAPYGTYAATSQNVGYPGLMTPGQNTITLNNEGVRTFAVGIAGPDDNPTYGFPITNAFKISNTLAGSLDSSVVSMLVHQKDSAASAIKFIGGGAIPGDQFEQNTLANLSSISLGTDDTLNLNVPKDATSPGSASDTIGFNVFTEKRGQNFRSGNGISFSTGNKTGGSSSPFDNSNFEITLNALNPLGSSSLPQFSLNTIGSNSQIQLLAGGGVVIPPSPSVSYSGSILGQARFISLLSQSYINLNSAGTVTLETAGNEIRTSAVNISLDATGNSNILLDTSNGDISLNSGGDIDIEANSTGLINIAIDQNIIQIDQNGIEIIGSAPTNANNVEIFAAASGGRIVLGTDSLSGNVSGTISIGEYGPGFSSKPFIVMDYSQTNDVMNLGGRISYQRTGTVTNSNAANQFIYIGSPPSQTSSGDVIMRHSSPSEPLDAGVALESWHNFSNSSVWIGKGGATSNNPSAADQFGLYVNQGSGFDQETTYNPTDERFKADRFMTRVNNRLSYGAQEQIIDIFQATGLISSEIVPTKPFVRIVAGPVQNISYSYANADNGSLASPGSFNLDFSIMEPSGGWVEGQRLHVELIAVSGRLEFSGASSYLLIAQPNIRCRFVQKTVSGSRQYSPYITTGTPNLPNSGGVPNFYRVSFELQCTNKGFQFYSTVGGGTGMIQAAMSPMWALASVPVRQDADTVTNQATRNWAMWNDNTNTYEDVIN